MLNFNFLYFLSHKHLKQSLDEISPQIIFAELDEQRIDTYCNDSAHESEFKTSHEYAQQKNIPFLPVDQESWTTMSNVLKAVLVDTLLLPVWPISALFYYL